MTTSILIGGFILSGFFVAIFGLGMMGVYSLFRYLK